jgi:hypothetical protein
LVAHEAESAQMGVEELHYGTAEGLQIAYHVPTPERTNPFRDGASHDGAAHVDASGDRSNSDQASPSHSPPVVRGRLWLFFNGNAGTSFSLRSRTHLSGFLLRVQLSLATGCRSCAPIARGTATRCRRRTRTPSFC